MTKEIIFDSKNPYWEHCYEYNEFFLKSKITHLQNVVEYGDYPYITLNGLYKELSIPPTKEGLIMGLGKNEMESIQLEDLGDRFKIKFEIINLLTL